MTDKHLLQASIGGFLLFKSANEEDREITEVLQWKSDLKYKGI